MSRQNKFQSRARDKLSSLAVSEGYIYTAPLSLRHAHNEQQLGVINLGKIVRERQSRTQNTTHGTRPTFIVKRRNHKRS